MSLKATVRRIAALAALAGVLASCAGEGGDVSRSAGPDDPAILKISYFRAFPDGKNKRLECFFRCVMSESWKDRMGDGPREQLAKAAPGRVYMGYVADVKMALYVRRLKEFGLDDLIAVRTEDLKPEEFSRLALSSQETNYTRIFTVGDEKGSRSYYYRKQQDRKDLIEKFVKCETYILRACEYAINVTSGSEPLPGRPLKDR
jgi:hypothetical protein